MARYWRSVVPAALCAAALSAVCLVGAHAQSDDEPAAEKEPAAKLKKQDPVEAQRAIEAAGKLLKSGKIDQAVRSLSGTLAGGNLPPAVMAKALYVRGLAYREQKKPAQAISDLTSALWLKGGLGGDERAEALKQRIEAYADAGLTEHGQALTAAGADHAPTKKSGGNWLSSLFSPSGADTPPPSRTKEAPAKEKDGSPVAAKAAPGLIGGWASKTEVQPDRTAVTPKAKAEVPPARETPPTRAEGRFQVQLAPVRTKVEAEALAAKAKREHAVLASSEPHIDQAVLGNMGAFYRVRFGPFANAQQTQAVCAELQGSGLDCMPVAP
jgi:tetratricopeptide (TPR) repeat protein